MFDKRVVDSEEFYSLPIESQCLYFHLGMNADVRGFVQPLKICRLTNIKPTSLTPLIHQKLVIAVADGVILITHWNVNNTVRIDREAPSPYTNLTQNIKTDKEGKYLIDGENGELLEYSGRTPAQYSIGKYSIGEVSIGEERVKKPTPKKENDFSKIDDLTVDTCIEVAAMYSLREKDVLEIMENLKLYCAQHPNKYKDYKAALQTWCRRDLADGKIEKKMTEDEWYLKHEGVTLL